MRISVWFRPVLLCGLVAMSSKSVLMQFCGKIMQPLAATIFFLFGLRKRGRYCETETTTIGIMASHHIVITVRHTRMQIPSQASLLDVVVFSHWCRRHLAKVLQKCWFRSMEMCWLWLGNFSRVFFHEVPQRSLWRDLCAGHGSGFVSTGLESGGGPACLGMFVVQPHLQVTFHDWFRWFPTVSWHDCFPSCTAADMTWVIQVVSNMSWHVLACLFFKLHCKRHDMSDLGELQHVLACLFCSLNCKRYSDMFWNVWWSIQVISSVRRQVTFGSEAADRLATSQTKKNAMACLQREWLVSMWSSPWYVMVGITRSKVISQTVAAHLMLWQDEMQKRPAPRTQTKTQRMNKPHIWFRHLTYSNHTET